ncbi:MAG: molybdopterin-guanine dinucleotide biosynthesis protein A [Candidatus Latescibacterota bacterium]|jgi:molybdopterin-guanine dinucleotide biosynthesis protein A
MSKYSSNCGAIVLAGGKSRRMGTSKAELRIGDQTMLERIVQTLDSIFETVVVVRALDQATPPIRESVIWTQDCVGDEGPLRGLEAGMLVLPDQVERVFVSGCDTPLLKLEFVAQLLELSSDVKAVVPHITGVSQPLTAVYATDILPVITEMLADGQRSLQALLRLIPTHLVLEDVLRQVDPQLVSLENVNTPADYSRILNLLGLVA